MATCVDKWHKGKRPRRPDCSFCRAEWHVPNLNLNPVKFPELLVRGYSVYHDWLYRKQICIGNFEHDGRLHPFFSTWLKAYFTGIEVEDNKFYHTLCEALADLCEDADNYPQP